MVQDGPPPGGFPSVRYARRLPSMGPTGPTLFLVSGAVMSRVEESAGAKGPPPLGSSRPNWINPASRRSKDRPARKT
jgi:GRIM-19 protein